MQVAATELAARECAWAMYRESDPRDPLRAVHACSNRAM